MTYEQPEALWIADWLNSHSDIGSDRAAAELRRLHEENEQLKKAVAEEREACAKLCEESDRYRGEYFAAIIRARGQV